MINWINDYLVLKIVREKSIFLSFKNQKKGADFETFGTLELEKWLSCYIDSSLEDDILAIQHCYCVKNILCAFAACTYFKCVISEKHIQSFFIYIQYVSSTHISYILNTLNRHILCMVQQSSVLCSFKGNL